MFSPLRIKVSDQKQSSGLAVEIEAQKFSWKPCGIRESYFRELGKMHPADAGFITAAPLEARKAIEEARAIEIELPGSEIAALNWEALSPGCLVRRSRAPAREFLPRSRFPIRMAIFATEETESTDLVRALQGKLGQDIRRGRIKIDVIRPRTSSGIFHALRTSHYDVIHMALPTLMRGRTPCVRVGRETVPTRFLFENTLVHVPRLALFHAATEKVEEGISGLRMASQVAKNLGTTCILHSAPPGDKRSHDFFLEAYGGAFVEDRDLLIPGQSRLCELDPTASVTAPAGRSSLLELRTELYSEMESTGILVADAKHLEKQFPEIALDLRRELKGFSQEPYDVSGAKEIRTAAGETVVSRLADAAKVTTRIRRTVGDVLRKRKGIIGRPDQERYPVGNFYHCIDDSEEGWEAIGKRKTLTQPPTGRRLEFHFWIDPINGGIRSINQGTFGPKNAVYPIDLVAQIWTESGLRFANDTSTLKIPAKGRSSHARFVLSDIPEHEDVEFFLFLLHGTGQLIAAFRIEARFREISEIDDKAQLIEQMFGSSDYFRFREKPGISALTILFNKMSGQLRVFTLAPGNRPWAKLGIDPDDLNASNREIYKHLTRVALDAATSERLGQPVSISKQILIDLAEKGWVLLQDLFSVTAEDEARAFLETVLALEPGSRITIATNDQTSKMIVPWGLLYLNNDFRQSPIYPVSVEDFFGYKYNVVVRPSLPLGPAKVEVGKPVRMAAAWLSRRETEGLKTKLDEAQAQDQIDYRRLKADEGKIPGLADEFDLIHFYCHGHTRFPDEFKPQEFLQLFRDHTQVGGGPTSQPAATELADFLQKVSNANDSLMELDGGFVYRSDLSSKMGRLKGAPIVLLSMCESAQVTPSGQGFITFFLNRGARAAMGTEGPTLWSLGRDLDLDIITRLLAGETIGEAFYRAKQEVVRKNPLGLIYSLWGERDAKIAMPVARRGARV
jgi:hypothetical protein